MSGFFNVSVLKVFLQGFRRTERKLFIGLPLQDLHGAGLLTCQCDINAGLPLILAVPCS